MLRGPPASLLAVLSGDNESQLFYAAVNTQEHDPHEGKGEVGKGSEGPKRGEKLLDPPKKRSRKMGWWCETRWRDGKPDRIWWKTLEEKEEKRKKREKMRIPFTPLSPANLLRNKLTSVSA